MKRAWIKVGVGILVGLQAATLMAQQVLDPETLKISPNRYKNSYVKVQDIFMHERAGIPFALSQAGYTLDKYVTFGARRAAMRCFMRRDSKTEELLGQFKLGDQITIEGTVKQPKATVADDTRFKHKEKLDIYIIEVSKLVKGWE